MNALLLALDKGIQAILAEGAQAQRTIAERDETIAELRRQIQPEGGAVSDDAPPPKGGRSRAGATA